MEPSLKPVHKTNTLALVILALATAAVVVFFYTAKTDIADTVITTEQNTNKTAASSTPQSDIASIESELNSAVTIDNSSDLSAIDKEF